MFEGFGEALRRGLSDLYERGWRASRRVMVDVVDPTTRSRMMSNITGRNTEPELLVRKFLFREGFRFRVHVKTLPGRPDIVLPKYKAIVLVHGCFWHRHEGCKLAASPKTRPEFWSNKLEQNVLRDKYNEAALQELGWRVIVAWECRLSDNDLQIIATKIRDAESTECT